MPGDVLHVLAGPPVRGASTGVHPRVWRGSLPRGGTERRGDGSIPACAGKPATGGTCRRPARVHPRVCGEARVMTIGCVALGGPSPRVRGSRFCATRAHSPQWSIPACAGKPRRPSATQPESGSIPACAGKPRPGVYLTRNIAVHPRVCGEAHSADSGSSSSSGPSPRVREAIVNDDLGMLMSGPSPRVRGKPVTRNGHPVTSGVHPRVCGEAISKVTNPLPDPGHPRVCGEASAGPRSTG